MALLLKITSRSNRKMCHIVSEEKVVKCMRENDWNVIFSLVFLCVFCVILMPVETIEIFRADRAYSFRASDPFIVDSRSGEDSFRVFWNSPTFQCRSHEQYFTDISRKYGITQNDGDSFRGNQIAILYDPGNFPALLENGSSSDYFYRNGGIPQEGDLNLHLEYFKDSLEKQIPDERFHGLGVIDFESWRPIFRQHWGKLAAYKEVSYNKEKERHPMWPNKWIQKEAAKRFEEAGRKFMEQTMAMARQIRPLATWGYYAYPYCFNMNGDDKKQKCSNAVEEENNSIQWLWDGTNSLLPSVYFGHKNLNPQQRLQLVKGRIAEAKRLQRRSDGDHPIYAYLWYKYNDDSSEFLTKEDLFNAINHMKQSGINGVILWGSSNDVDTKQKCNLLQDYIQNVLGPVVKEIIQTKHRSSQTETVTDNIINEKNGAVFVPKIDEEIRPTIKTVEEVTQKFKGYPEENDREEPYVNVESVEEKQDTNESVKDIKILSQGESVEEKQDTNESVKNVIIVSQGEANDNVISMINFKDENIGDTRIDYENMKIEFIPLKIPQIMPNIEKLNGNGEVIEVPKGGIFIAMPAAHEGTYPSKEDEEISLMKVRSKIYTVVGMYPRVYQFSPRQR